MEGNNHIELYYNVRWFKVSIEDPPDGFFQDIEDSTIIHNDEVIKPLPEEVIEHFKLGRPLTLDEVGIVQNAITINDDNKPATENIPPASALGWVHDGMELAVSLPRLYVGAL
jgi:hypothetical protein